ncbi:MAG: hypothetical protein OQK98_02350 [Gammaproteobacteria bacterium]|nr:hypothetical protein [Gammaproteobacteria bacterium]
MQLDKIIIALRQRTPWEAMDLGVMVMRKLWPVILFPWLILMSCVLVFVIFAEYQGYFYFAGFFIWLIKPVYESMILHIISHGIFGEYLTTSDVFSSMGKWLKTGLLTSFLFWRLSPSRSFNMPVHLLEGLSGSRRKQRLESLHRVAGSHSMGLTIIGVHFEYVVLITLYVTLFFIAPESTTEYFKSVVDNNNDQTLWFIIGSVLYAITLFILEPFYVASGFMLYLNRRTQLEGWDIELDFKKLAQRIDEPRYMVNNDMDKSRG